METIPHYKQFFSSHSFYEGVRATIGIMVPVLAGAFFQHIGWGLAMAVGALCTSFADNAGPIHHRINGMLAAICACFFASLFTGLVLPYPILFVIWMGIAGFGCSMMMVFGNRAGFVGTAALVVLTLQMDSNDLPVVQTAGLTSLGGLWYFTLSVVLYRMRPYKLVQQVLGDCMLETAHFLQIKAGFYASNPNYDNLYAALSKAQIDVHNKQQLVRELLFKTRHIVKESTHIGRVLVMAFLDTIDLFENIMTSQQDYKQLHQQLDSNELLSSFQSLLLLMSDELKEIGTAMQEGSASIPNKSLQEKLVELEATFVELRQEQLDERNLEAFIALRHILNSIVELASRLETLHVYTTYDKQLTLKKTVDYQQFVIPSNINFKLLRNNFSTHSNIFRYSLRMAIAMIAGYGLSFLLPLGHSYWIILTIVVVLKPAYSLTRNRNRERLAGTLAGGILGVAILTFVHIPWILLAVVVVCMVGAFSLLRTRYGLGVALLTVYVLVALQLLKPGDFATVLLDRVWDTVIGGSVGLVFTWLIPPIWEKLQIKDLAFRSITATRAYFSYISSAFIGAAIQVMPYKLYRKEAFVAFANFSDGFQKMLSEPISNPENGEYFHQLVVSNHVLLSHVATLSGYRVRFGKTYATAAFQTLIDMGMDAMQVELLTESTTSIAPKAEAGINATVKALLAQRKEELRQGKMESDIARTLSDLKTLSDQFAAIIRVSGDIKRVYGKLEK